MANALTDLTYAEFMKFATALHAEFRRAHYHGASPPFNADDVAHALQVVAEGIASEDRPQKIDPNA